MLLGVGQGRPSGAISANGWTIWKIVSFLSRIKYDNLEHKFQSKL
jgi:hypothetical protein